MLIASRSAQLVQHSSAVALALLVSTTPLLARATGRPGDRCPPGNRCVLDGDPVPSPVKVVTGKPLDYRPVATFEPKGILVQLRLSLGGRTEGVSPFTVDRYGDRFDTGGNISPVVRLGAIIDTRLVLKKVNIYFEYEHDLPTGTWTNSSFRDTDGMPNSTHIQTQLRKAYARVSLGYYLHLGGGFMTNHWGMGLVANDGAHGWEPGSGQFVDPRFGNRVLRAFLATGPLTKADIQAAVAFDQVRGDDLLLNGDSAIQVIAEIQAGTGKPNGGGFFFVHRRQKTAGDQSFLNVSVFDLAGRAQVRLCKGLKLKLEGEVAVISGSTSLGPTPEHPEHDVLQVGAGARANFDAGKLGMVWDFLFASGDHNYDDGRVTNFKADSNYPMGILLFRYVNAAQSARAPFVAGDPQLVGYPNQNLERVPTRGSASNTIAFFPRLWTRPVAGLELYTGVLLAWTVVANNDPFNTKIAGGSNRNALNTEPGSFYGAEFDFGVRYRMLVHGTQLMLGAEGGSLLPGSAFAQTTGSNMSSVVGGRLMIEYRL